ncbi:MAG TPA: TonB-dependent receptor [Prolixibacteraceae bacterium]|nr:TonB-dependent receptor [Prolixibacteraceae bacterium]
MIFKFPIPSAHIQKTFIFNIYHFKVLVFATALPVLLFLTPGANAQQVRVTDQITSIPIEGVVVYSDGFVTQSDHLGQVLLNGIQPEQLVSFYHPSYLPFSVSKSELEKLAFTVVLTEAPHKLDEVVVSVSRGKLIKSRIPGKVDVILSNSAALAAVPTTADLSGLSGEVFVQKSQQGGGSPMLRGFSANRLLLVVDGFRMNNAIFRSGNLQNIVSVDPLSLESIEVAAGPGSVIYGSDALGGVLSMTTYKPEFSWSGKVESKRMFTIKSASANSEKTLHGHWMTSGKQWGFVISGTYSRFDDLMMGKYGPSAYLRPEYVVPDLFAGKDSVVKNNNQRIQKFSGYEQMNLLGKVRFKPVKTLDITLGSLYSFTGDVPRYDRLIVYKGKRLRYGEWYYGPQTWWLNSASLIYTRNHLLFDESTLLAGFQRYEESRHDRNIDKPELYHRTEKLHVFSVSLNFSKNIRGKALIDYGAEASAERIWSNGISEHLISGKETPVAPRYPDHSAYRNLSAYIQSRYHLSDKLSLHGGIRATQTSLSGDFPRQYYSFPVDGFRSVNRAFNGNFGLLYNPSAGGKINLLYSTGFRSPNMDDMAKIFDSEPGHVMVPNPGLKPEYARNLEAGYMTGQQSPVTVELTVFYTWLRKAMVRRDFQFNGQDSILYNQVMSKVEALVNTDGAEIYGGTCSVSFSLVKNLKSKNSITWMRGKDSDGLPVRHVPPLYGNHSVIWEKEPWKAELNFRYNGAIPFSRLAADERDKPYLYLSDDDGNPYSPGWYTLNLLCNYDITEKVKISGGIENLLNQRYRPYSSGIAAPSRNLTISVSVAF